MTSDFTAVTAQAQDTCHTHGRRHRFEPWRSHRSKSTVTFSRMCIRCGVVQKKDNLRRWDK